MIDVIIQIVHYRTPKLLEDCLRAIFTQQTNLAFSVSVLDNSLAPDDLAQVRAKWQDRVHFTTSDQNFGYGKGHNLLMQSHKTESTFTLLINPSVKLHTPHDLDALVSFMRTTPACGAAGPQLIDQHGKRQITSHGELHGWRAWLLGLASYRLSKSHKTPARVAWVCGAALLIRSELLQQLGGFDPEFFLFREEEDLLQRLRTAGWEVWLNPQVRATHVIHASGTSYKEFMAASHRHFCRKHMSPFNPIPRIFEFTMKLIGLWKQGS